MEWKRQKAFDSENGEAWARNPISGDVTAALQKCEKGTIFWFSLLVVVEFVLIKANTNNGTVC